MQKSKSQAGKSVQVMTSVGEAPILTCVESALFVAITPRPTVVIHVCVPFMGQISV